MGSYSCDYGSISVGNWLTFYPAVSHFFSESNLSDVVVDAFIGRYLLICVVKSP